MFRRLCIATAATTAALICGGCATSLTKPGMTQASLNADTEACWKHVLATPAGREAAEHYNNARVAGSLIGGGPIAAAVAIADQSATNSRSNYGNKVAHNVCMSEKGYTASAN